jgi:hypothetical protein
MDIPISNGTAERLKDDQQESFAKKTELDIEKSLRAIRAEVMRSSGNIGGKIRRGSAY